MVSNIFYFHSYLGKIPIWKSVTIVSKLAYFTLGGGNFKYFWNFHPEAWGRFSPILTNIFFRWVGSTNHQPVIAPKKDFAMIGEGNDVPPGCNGGKMGGSGCHPNFAKKFLEEHPGGDKPAS